MPRSVNPTFQKSLEDMNGPQLWQQYRLCLKEHDWSYQYSDDHQVWRVGQSERDYLNRLFNLVLVENKVEAGKLYEEHRPEGC